MHNPPQGVLSAEPIYDQGLCDLNHRMITFAKSRLVCPLPLCYLLSSRPTLARISVVCVCFTSRLVLPDMEWQSVFRLTIGAHVCPPLPLSSINLLIMPSPCSGCPEARISSSHHPTYTQCHRHAPKLPVSSVSRMVLFRQTPTLMFHTHIVSMRPQTVHGHPQPNLPCDVHSLSDHRLHVALPRFIYQTVLFRPTPMARFYFLTTVLLYTGLRSCDASRSCLRYVPLEEG